jgi:diacylglycerol O-acyltransferase / wax synthase
MKRLTPNDALFLFAESRETMMHVASMMPFTPPPDAGPDFLRDVWNEIRRARDVTAPWNLKLRHPGFLKHPMPAWIEDERLDMDYHVRRSALPSPGGERELGVLVSRLHANPIDFSRPPWELHIIEGLERGRFALYTKIHHALIDGFTGNRMLARSFPTDPADMSHPLFFSIPQPARERVPSTLSPWEKTLLKLRRQADAAREVVAALGDVREALRGRPPGFPTEAVEAGIMAMPTAPNCILNGRIGRNRRFATQQYELERLKKLARDAGGTLNDIVLHLCATALRRFLLELHELPSMPLVAMLPVNIRPKDDPGGGNAVGTIFVSLATDLEDPVARLEAIMASARRGKSMLKQLSRDAIMQLSALMMAPSGVQTIAGLMGRVRPQFNLCISNVPGPEEPLYFRGARLEATYPLSIPIHGQALNITCQSYAGTLNFGFTGCRDTLPRLQRLAVYTGEALVELEEALAANRVI